MANENMIKFLRGNVANLPQTATAGALYFTKDEGIYLGMEDGSYHRYGDFITVADVNALPTSGAHATCMYYCTKENILARFDSEKGWIQINKQPTAEELKTLLGLDSYATKAYVGDIPNDEDGNPMAASVIAYINKKTDGIATSGNLEALGNRVGTAEGEIDALQEASARHVEKEEGKSLIADTEITRLAGMSDGANKVEASETNGNIKIDGVETTVYTHPDKHAIDDVDGLQDALNGLQAKGDYAAEEHTHTKGEITDFTHTHTASEITDFADEVAKVKVTNAGSSDSAKKVENALTVKVGGADVVFDGSEAKTADVDAAIEAAIDALPEQTDYTVTITENTDDATVAKTYVFTQNGAEIGAIKLAKELVVTSGSVKEVTEADAPYAGAKVGDKYIELVIANQDAPIYVPAKDLVDIYTAKDGATEVQIAISNTNEISATLVNGGITEEKLAEGVKTKLNKVYEEVGVAKSLVDALAETHATDKAALEEAIEGAKTEAANQDAVVLAEAQKYADAAKADAIADAEGKVNALAGNVYTKEEVYTKAEVENLLTWGSF